MSNLFASNGDSQPPNMLLTVPQSVQWGNLALSSDKNLSCPPNSKSVQVNIGVPSTGASMTYYTCLGNSTKPPHHQ